MTGGRGGMEGLGNMMEVMVKGSGANVIMDVEREK
jgi:hypothetical protein